MMYGLWLTINLYIEQIARFEAENEQIRREFEREKVKLEASNRDLQRDKSCNECEIRVGH